MPKAFIMVLNYFFYNLASTTRSETAAAENHQRSPVVFFPSGPACPSPAARGITTIADREKRSFADPGHR